MRIIDGYYFETYNDTVNKVIKGLYELRQKLKAKKNESGQEVIKMIMNASYGKCCLKPSTTNTEVVSSKQFDKYMGLHGSDVKWIVKYDGFWCVTTQNNKIKHANRVHVSSVILANSKKHMNKLMVSAQKAGIKIFY